jgi:hypothetical protein
LVSVTGRRIAKVSAALVLASLTAGIAAAAPLTKDLSAARTHHAASRTSTQYVPPGWVTYQEAVKLGLPWAGDDTPPPGMRVCRSDEINRDYPGVRAGETPPVDAPECYARKADSGAVVPGNLTEAQAARQIWRMSAFIPPQAAQ